MTRQLREKGVGVLFLNDNIDSIYGCRISPGELAIQAGQAEIVRQVYDKFLAERKGTYTIARELTEAEIVRVEGSATPLPKELWRGHGAVMYCGVRFQREIF